MTLHYTIISKIPYVLRILKWSQVYTLTNFCSQKYCQQFLYDSHLKLSSLSYYTVHTHLFNCQFKCSNQGSVWKQKEFLRSGLWGAITNRVWLLAFFVKRSVKFRMNLWGHHFSKIPTKIFPDFCPTKQTRIVAKKLTDHIFIEWIE